MNKLHSFLRRGALVLGLGALFGSLPGASALAQPQNPGTYNFGKITRTYTSIANSTGSVPTLTGNSDEGFYNALPIGFTFRFAGVNYTSASASTNGWLTFGQSISNAAPANNLTSGGTRPLLAPLWDDLQMNAGGFYYLTQGSAPDRVFVAEWNNVRWDKGATLGIGCLSFQVRLYEGSNRVEYAYRQASGALNAPSASIGLAGVGSGNFISLSDASASPGFSTLAETTIIASKPATGQTYAFTPASPTGNATSLSTYTATAAAGTYNTLQPNTPLSGGTDDDGYYNGLPIGFTFRFAGVDYTDASASTNGWLLLGQNIPASVGQFGYTNDLDGNQTGRSNNGLYPVLAPLWDDLSMGSGAFYYFTSGSAPNRVFTVEWYNAKWNYTAANPVISFQIRLYETSNRLEYNYRQEAGVIGSDASLGASIGMATGVGANNFLSLSGSGATPGTSYTTETTTIATKPATGQVYAFTPPAEVARLVSSTSAFSSLAGGTALTRSGGNATNGWYNGLPIGFTFGYGGGQHTTVSASTNGWLTFGQNISGAVAANDLGDPANAAPRPLLAPLWDNLSLVDGALYSTTTGTAPNRVFTLEWSNVRWRQVATAASISFQVKLYEGSNRVDYVYQREAGATDAAPGASIGLSPAPGVYLALDGTGTSPTASASVNTNNLSVRPATGQTYSFFPLSLNLAASIGTYTNGIPLSGGTADDGYYNDLPIGFPFQYEGVNHATVSVSTNGWLTLGQTISAATTAPANNLATAGVRPLLAPLWDDLSLAQGSVYYQTSGTAPTRIFTVEWYRASWEKAAAAPTISFEAKLYEGTNRIEFVYRPEAGASNAGAQSASIGITATATGTGNYLALNGTGTNPGASNSINSTTLSGRPANAQIYGFAPAGINPLPVQLVGFAGEARGLDALLSWHTAQELRNDHFVLERSADGRAFEAVATVPGHGTTALPQRYAHRDAQGLRPGATTYYRLRQVDTDGTAHFSPVLPLQAGLRAAEATLQLFPNPARQQVQLWAAPAATAQLLDLSGRLLRTFATGQPLALAGLPAGVYLVRCGSQTARLVVE